MGRKRKIEKPEKPKRRLRRAPMPELPREAAEVILQEVPTPEVAAVVGEEAVRRSPLVMFSDAAVTVERARIAAQVRLKHLARRKTTDPDTEELLERTHSLERWVDRRLAERVKAHPAAHWFTKVKGTGGELIGKVIGHIEAFGRFYHEGDPCIPREVRRPPITIPIEEPRACPACKYLPEQRESGEYPMVWVEGIERLTMPSKLRRFAGLVPGERRRAGEKTRFSNELRVMMWRLGSSFLKMGGKYAEFYYDYKNRLLQRLQNEGIRVLPTPRGRYCANCQEEVVLSRQAMFCPKCGEKLALKQEPEGVRWEGHVHMMAMRRMLQLFLDHLWAVWREALNLPLREPYPIEYLGHTTLITPSQMVDRQEE